MKPLLPYLRLIHRPLALAIFLLVLRAGTEVLSPWPVRQVIDHVLLPGHRPRVSPSLYLSLAALSLVALAVVAAVSQYLAQKQLGQAGQHLLYRLRLDLFSALLHKPLDSPPVTAPGDLLTRLTSDLSAIQDLLLTRAGVILNNLFTLIAIAVGLCLLDFRLALLLLPLLGALAYVLSRYTGRLKENMRAVRRVEGRLLGIASEALSDVGSVQALSLGEVLQGEFAHSARKTRQLGMHLVRLQALMPALLGALLLLLSALALWTGGSAVLSGQFTTGELVVLLSYLRSLVSPLRQLSRQSSSIGNALAAVERVVVLLPYLPPGAMRPVCPTGGERVPVSLNRLFFHYPKNPPLFTHLDLQVDAGEMAAIMGQSGTGKTSLFNLLLGLHTPIRGEIHIGPRRLADLSPEERQGCFGVVPQTTLLFTAPLWENIAAAWPGSDREAAEEALAAVGLTRLFALLPDGLGTVVGSGGRPLSGGQMRAVAIARALLRPSPVLLLDEPTAGLDAESQAVVEEALLLLKGQRTVLLITHEAHLASLADQVYRLRNGRLEAVGALNLPMEASLSS